MSVKKKKLHGIQQPLSNVSCVVNDISKHKTEWIPFMPEIPNTEGIYLLKDRHSKIEIIYLAEDKSKHFFFPYIVISNLHKEPIYYWYKLPEDIANFLKDLVR